MAINGNGGCRHWRQWIRKRRRGTIPYRHGPGTRPGALKGSDPRNYPASSNSTISSSMAPCIWPEIRTASATGALRLPKWCGDMPLGTTWVEGLFFEHSHTGLQEVTDLDIIVDGSDIYH